ncbi:MAG: response regulator [Candidatus Scalinduaceae bacterium]
MRKKTLIIDDNSDHVELIIEELKAKDNKNEIISIKNGKEAINYFKKIYTNGDDGKISKIELIILDINLPKVKGLEVLKFIKGHRKFRSIPVFVVSTSYDKKTVTEAYKNGANGFIAKPNFFL